MSNYLILCSDKPLKKTKLNLKKILIDKKIWQNLSLPMIHSYSLDPVADIEKTREAELSAPEFYKATCRFFEDLYDLCSSQLKVTSNVFLIQTFYGQNFKDIFLVKQVMSIDKLKLPYISFDFNTIYQFANK